MYRRVSFLCGLQVFKISPLKYSGLSATVFWMLTENFRQAYALILKGKYIKFNVSVSLNITGLINTILNVKIPGTY
jgi:hypothetical protein